MVTPEFNGAFDSNQMDALQQRGELEASLMSRDVQETLEAPIKKSKKKGKSSQSQVVNQRLHLWLLSAGSLNEKVLCG